MRLADRMGFLVIDEVPAVGLFANFSAALDMSPGEKKVVKTWEVMNTTENHKCSKELIQRDKNYDMCCIMDVLQMNRMVQEKVQINILNHL